MVKSGIDLWKKYQLCFVLTFSTSRLWRRNGHSLLVCMCVHCIALHWSIAYGACVQCCRCPCRHLVDVGRRIWCSKVRLVLRLLIHQASWTRCWAGKKCIVHRDQDIGYNLWWRWLSSVDTAGLAHILPLQLAATQSLLGGRPSARTDVRLDSIAESWNSLATVATSPLHHRHILSL